MNQNIATVNLENYWIRTDALVHTEVCSVVTCYVIVSQSPQSLQVLVTVNYNFLNQIQNELFL